MAPAPNLPTRFPCWCRAVYSWGGETKRDLGFVEGDLIECLNAGDGAWWTGRLRRDKRMVGVFPSNFVEVLGEDFVPGSRSVSPMASVHGKSEDLRRISTANSAISAPRKNKTVFRKPFQGYKEVVGPSEALKQAKHESMVSSLLASQNQQSQSTRRSRPTREDSSSSRRPRSSVIRQRESISKSSARASPSQQTNNPQNSAVHHRSSLSKQIAPEPSQQPVYATQNYANQQQGPMSRPTARAHSPQPRYDISAPMQHRGSISNGLPRVTSPQPSYDAPVSGVYHRGSFSNPVARAPSPQPQSLYDAPDAFASGIRHHGSFSNSFSSAPSPQPTYEVPITGLHHRGSISNSIMSAPSPQPPYDVQIPGSQHRGSFSNPFLPISSPQPVYGRPGSQMQHRGSFSNALVRVPSSHPIEDREGSPSPPPPPPPPHRISVKGQAPMRQSGSPTPTPFDHNRPQGASRTPSPQPHSPAIHGNTPSPLRDAMEDVMTSLHDMGRGASPEPEVQRTKSPFQPWSPEAFDNIGDQAPPNPPDRPLTSLGLGGGSQRFDAGQPYGDERNDGPPQLNNYVQRMEERLKQLHEQNGKSPDELHLPGTDKELPPPPPPKGVSYQQEQPIPDRESRLKNRKSAYELGREVLGRTFTTKSSTTNSSSGVQSTSTNGTSSTGLTGSSMMSGPSASGFSATSAGSFARRGKFGSFSRERPTTAIGSIRSGGFMDFDRGSQNNRPQTPSTGISYHSSHNTSRQGASSAVPWSDYQKTTESPLFGGLTTTPKTKKTGFLKKILESAKTGAATARSSIAANPNGGTVSPTKSLIPRGISAMSSHDDSKQLVKDVGPAGNMDWVQVRRDVNRCTTPSQNELVERAERCQMVDYPVIYAVEELYESAEGDEGIDGLPLAEPTNWSSLNLQLVDRSTRFIGSLPPMITPASLAQGYVCRPHRSDVQRLRAIFTWVGEKIAWDDDIDGEINVRRVVQVRRGSSREVAALVMEMCSAVGLQAEVVHGYLKSPGEQLDLDSLSRPNHWWNTVLIDGEWRIMDCSLSSPTHPRRSLYSSTNSHSAENWYFLARPLEICYTHVPLEPAHQHICPPISPDVLLALPCACPAFFKNGLHAPNYDTSLIRINGLEAVQIRIHVPPDIECAAEVEALVFARDSDGDLFESGDITKKRALAQADWIGEQKRFTIKAVLPGDEGQGVLKVYAGKKGLMHSSKDIPHPLALSLPIVHTGENPPYEFLLRHPTPHAQRHDLYVIQPQCAKLAINNTFVFAVRQHPSSPPSSWANSSDGGGNIGGRVSPNPFARPSSSLSMVSSVATSNASSSSYSNQPFSASSSTISSNNASRDKPAKLAVQSPSGKILRLTRKAEHMISTTSGAGPPPDGSVWETVIKIGERGVWRGLVLADRSARWCVFGEWECV